MNAALYPSENCIEASVLEGEQCNGTKPEEAFFIFITISIQTVLIFFFFKLSFHLKGLYFRLTGCCSWRLSALCFLSRENEFLFIHLSYIATFLNRSSYKFCFQIVILVIKGEQNSMVRRTELRIHAFLTLLSIHMSSFRMEYSRYFSLPSFSTSFPYNLVCFAFQYSICFWVISPCGIFLNRYSLSENWDTESLQSQEWRYY